MSNEGTPVASVWPYVLCAGLIKLACVGLAYGYTAATGQFVPDLSTPVTFAAVGGAIAWYSYAENRPMRLGQLLLFSLGVALIDLALSLLIIIVPIVWYGEAVSVHNIDLVLGGDGRSTLGEMATVGGFMLFGELSTFGLSLFFAWTITRKLPRDRKGGQREL